MMRLKRAVIHATYYPTWWYTRVLCALSIWQKWTWVTPNVLLGCRPTRRDLGKIKSLGISVVINLCEEFRGYPELLSRLGIEPLAVATPDYQVPTLEDLTRGVAFMADRIAAGRKVYVHCKAGRVRSVALVMCYLMATQQLTAKEAHAFILKKRRQIDRNLANRSAVVHFEAWSSSATGATGESKGSVMASTRRITPK